MENNELDDILNEFITESFESLDQLGEQLVAIEQHPDAAVLARIFRSVHTIKGTSGFLGLRTLETVTHAGENVLSKLRDGHLTSSSDITTTLLKMLDAVRRILVTVETSGIEGAETYTDLVNQLTAIDSGIDLAPGPQATPAATLELGEQAAVIDDDRESRRPDRKVRILRPRRDDSSTSSIGQQASRPAEVEPTDRIGERLMGKGLVNETQVGQALLKQESGDPRHVGELLVESAIISPTEVVETLTQQSEDRSAVNESIRVDVGLLDDLMNLVGELVLARNQILQSVGTHADTTLNATAQRLDSITSALQEIAMKTRMQPIGNVWSKFPRIVRDLSIECDKQARLEMTGKQTEVDKTLLEAIKDPLVHLIRNAIDHGLESPPRRVAVGKPAEGVVRLAAYHEGGQVVIEISDDGRGIDADAVRAKAVQQGLMTAAEAAERSDADVVNTIFLAGFSTADQVSNISGRGVGMDVVKTNIEAIGGSIDLQTRPGLGTTITVKVPLTLAIIPALIISAGGDRYAIPQVGLLELIRIPKTPQPGGLEFVQGAAVHRLRGKLLPLVSLIELFDATPTGADDETITIVVVQADDTPFGLIVDEISDTAEIVVKPLGRILRSASAFAGATIMGDGRVSLILDLAGIASLASIAATSAACSRADLVAVPLATNDDLAEQRSDQAMLIVGVCGRSIAVPLAAVARLEELPCAAVRAAGTKFVVHYRDNILPLVSLASGLAISSTGHEPWDDGRTNIHVVVCGADGFGIGLVVDEVHDIVDHTAEYSDQTKAFGILGTMVVGHSITDVLDLEAFVAPEILASGRSEVAA